MTELMLLIVCSTTDELNVRHGSGGRWNDRLYDPDEKGPWCSSEYTEKSGQVPLK